MNHVSRVATGPISFALLLAVANPPSICGAPPNTAKRNSGAAATNGETGVRLVRVPNRGIQPQVAVDTEGTLHMIYLGDEPGAANVFYVRKAAGDGDQFSKPLRVNSQSGSAIAIGSIRGAHLAIGKANRVHVAWNGSGTAEPKGDAKYGNPMLYSRLSEDGAEFEPQRNVIRVAYGLDGGGSVAADLDGNVYVAWHAGDGTGEANRRIWVVHSSDDGASFDDEHAADSNREGVCGCCGMKAFADRAGTLYLFYRSAREKVNRDMALLISNNRGKSFRSEIAGNWVIPTCPMSSEAFAETPEAVLAAWETNGQVFFTRVDKEKHRLSNPIPAPGTGAGRKHPALAVNGKGETLLAWDEGTGWERGGSLAWQVFDERGKPTKSRGKADGIPVWSFPAVYADADDAFVIVY
jgi:hypothetical protein